MGCLPTSFARSQVVIFPYKAIEVRVADSDLNEIKPWKNLAELIGFTTMYQCSHLFYAHVSISFTGMCTQVKLTSCRYVKWLFN